MGVYQEAIGAIGDALDRARATGRRNMNAMSLATIAADGTPSVRTVLVKQIDQAGLVFFTDARSRKGRDLSVDPRASVCFYWEPLEEQARIDGVIEPVDPQDVERDFDARPRAGQVMIWASEQSAALKSETVLKEQIASVEARYPETLPVPDFWVGYRLVPHYIELWRGRRDRLHERVAYTLDDGEWARHALQP
ncbi:MAG: pyridoxamine 5'-phosphate oxidase [Pseudomonadota bacterium]